MKTLNYENYACWEPEESTMRKVIYLDDHRGMRVRCKNNKADTLWNVIFTGLCLSVLVVLFLH